MLANDATSENWKNKISLVAIVFLLAKFRHKTEIQISKIQKFKKSDLECFQLTEARFKKK
jgi:hypothetical protein